MGWHSVLNDFCHAITMEDLEQYEDMEKTLKPSDFEQVKLQSWQQIFDLSLLPDPDTHVVQAVFWALRKEQVKGVDYFIAR